MECKVSWSWRSSLVPMGLQCKEKPSAKDDREELEEVETPMSLTPMSLWSPWTTSGLRSPELTPVREGLNLLWLNHAICWILFQLPECKLEPVSTASLLFITVSRQSKNLFISIQMTELCRWFKDIEVKFMAFFFLITGIQITTFVRITIILADKRNTDEEFRTK